MRLRLATVDDLPALCVLGRLLCNETSLAGMDFDNDKFKETVLDLIDKNQLVQVAEDTNGEVIGAMLCKVAPTWFGNDLIATEMGLFIHPGHRGGMPAVSPEAAGSATPVMAPARGEARKPTASATSSGAMMRPSA